MSRQTKIRANHPYSFRAGEWATLMGTYTLSTGEISSRDCYVVVFPDGALDLFAVEDTMADYEFKDE